MQAERAVALRQGRGGEGAEQVGGVHGGLFSVALKQCGFVWLVGLFGGFVLRLGLRYFLVGFIFRFGWKIFPAMCLHWRARNTQLMATVDRFGMRASPIKRLGLAVYSMGLALHVHCAAGRKGLTDAHPATVRR